MLRFVYVAPMRTLVVPFFGGGTPEVEIVPERSNNSQSIERTSDGIAIIGKTKQNYESA